MVQYFEKGEILGQRFSMFRTNSNTGDSRLLTRLNKRNRTAASDSFKITWIDRSGPRGLFVRVASLTRIVNKNYIRSV